MITPSLWRLVSGNEILATNERAQWRTVHSNTSFNGKLVSGYTLSTAPVRFVTGEVGWICTWSAMTGDIRCGGPPMAVLSGTRSRSLASDTV